MKSGSGSPTLGILDLLGLAGLPGPEMARIEFVRHEGDPDFDLQDLHQRGWLDTYQQFQSKPVFDNLDYIVSFIGMDGWRARFLGVYRVGARRPSANVSLPKGCRYQSWRKFGYHYDLQRMPRYDHLKERVVIDWGKGRRWHQRASNKTVVEVRPAGYFLEPFDDYLQFILTYDQLVRLVKHREAHKEWQARLSAVAGVYLILATKTGKQYIGSAYGAEGIWGRWLAYAHDGHGGNKLLKKLIDTNPSLYPESFSYSVLEVLPNSFARKKVLAHECQFKKKLGTRATGLNTN
jgi:hypothetical protein